MSVAVCALCGRSVESKLKARRIQNGVFKVGKFYPTRNWGYVHSSCMDRLWPTPGQALEEMKVIEERVLRGK